ncbi:hypothetical protein J8C01_09885 [Chloracidobacterium sp. D]|uniref:hypothetical protein n=1 Tax=Chloracidobacterium sp. D TaxID=2821536 RepID=UPI001B8D7C59|nr:hypothetical protein [Chloracidobacterium sp. D]QUV81520.1 hypothetical protein J8C01_09885 [Chloracidobacterium sp. D]
MGFNPRSATPPTPRRVATDEYRRNDTISRPHGNAGAIVRIHHESGHPRWGSAVADATGTIGGRRDPWVETHGKILLPLRGKHAVATYDQRPTATGFCLTAGATGLGARASHPHGCVSKRP